MSFTCAQGTSQYPDKDIAIEDIITDNQFSVSVGISTLDHTYGGGGTWQKVNPLQFGADGLNPDFVYLNELEFACNSVVTTTNVTNAVYDNVSGIVTVTTTQVNEAAVGSSTSWISTSNAPPVALLHSSSSRWSRRLRLHRNRSHQSYTVRN